MSEQLQIPGPGIGDRKIIRSTEDIPMIVRSRVDDAIGQGDVQKEGNMPIIRDEDDPTHVWDEIIGRTFLLKPDKDGQKFRARIVDAIKDHDNKLEKDMVRQKFLLSVNNDTAERVMAYGEIMDQLANKIEDPQGSKDDQTLGV